MPSEKTSLAGPAGCPSTCSGDMYGAVPSTVPGRVARVALPRRHAPGQAEVEDLEQAVAPHHQVVRFEVAMDEAGAVRDVEGAVAWRKSRTISTGELGFRAPTH